MAGPGNVPLAETAAGRTLLGLVGLVGRDLPRSEVMAWLTSCPVKAPEARRLTIHASHWDAISRKAGVVGGLDHRQQRLDRYAADTVRVAEDGVRSRDVADARIPPCHGQV